MHERTRRPSAPATATPVPLGPSPRRIQARALTPSPSSMQLGAVDDPAEREADRIAGSIDLSGVTTRIAARQGGAVQRPAGPLDQAATEVVTRAPASRIVRSSRRSAAVIRRSVYLFNGDDSIYKDTEREDLELAFLMKVKRDAIFVEYGAIDRLRFGEAYRKIAGAYGSGPASPPKAKGPTSGAVGIDSSKVSKSHGAGSKVRARAQQKDTAGRDKWLEIQRDLMQAVQRQTPEGRKLAAALGTVYAYDSATQILDIADVDAKFRARLVSQVINTGPSQMRTGGGSRLPAPAGIVFALGADRLDRSQILSSIGIEPADQPAYARVALRHVDPVRYQALLQSAGTANCYELTSNDGGMRLLYSSGVETARASHSRIQVAGATFGDEKFVGMDPASADGQKIAASYATLTPPTADTGWIAGTALTARDRGQGQAAAMNSWNALGAAAYGNVFLGRQYDLKQNWEWLHLQGAQIGGATTGGNLVAGLYVTNSAMIPYESMVERWARTAPHNFSARFVATGIDGAFCRSIELWISAQDHPELGTLPPRRLASFDPCTGKIVDKLAGEFVKRSTDQRVRV